MVYRELVPTCPEPSRRSEAFRTSLQTEAEGVIE